ncbi:hypothetical protein Y1Q_0023295 [Alligator mississippiensis]|uniref:Uncharacterized protein n=1 Tax=Alligator mississippiensis TaxID=8496 RepID=A0A151MTT5_ALLMI|nr:hypothetical protein Y1Q_0023295 [Alligator mississippiensis]
MTRREEDFDMIGLVLRVRQDSCGGRGTISRPQITRAFGFQHGSPLPIRSDGGDLRRKAARCPQEVPALGS